MKLTSILVLSIIALSYTCCQVTDTEVDSAQSITSVPSPKLTNKKNFWDSAISGFSLIFISEIGDKTFFLTMIYAASNPFLKAFTLTSITMLSMNAISLLIGFSLPFLLYRDYIDWIGITVFSFFGIFLLYNGLTMESKLIDEEYEEVEKEVRKVSISSHKSAGLRVENKDLQEKMLIKEQNNKGISAAAYMTSLVLAELGDRSQITAIVIGAINNFYGVLLGTSLAFIMCILCAIFFGNFLKKILTTRQLTLIGAVAFLLFALMYLLEKLKIF